MSKWFSKGFGMGSNIVLYCIVVLLYWVLPLHVLCILPCAVDSPSDHCQAKLDYGVKKSWAKAHFIDFDFWGFKYHLICKIGLKLSTFFDFILSWSWKKSFYYPFQRAGGTPTVPWVMAYPCSMGFYKIYRSSVLLLQPYWNALLTQRILDIFCCVKWRKSFWYPF